MEYNEEIHNKALRILRSKHYKKDCEKANICCMCGGELEEYDPPGSDFQETRCSICKYVMCIN